METRVSLLLMTLIFSSFFGYQAKAEESVSTTTCATASHILVQDATALEVSETCKSADKISAYFNTLGFSPDMQMKVIFSEAVFLPLPGVPEADRPAVYGYFDTDTREVHMMHFHSVWNLFRKVWNVDWSDETASSFLLHEMTHLAAVSILGADFKRLNHGWHEGLAYYIQFRLMPDSLREQILKASPSTPFAGQDSLTTANYQMSPDIYAEKSYLSFRQWGGDDFVRDLLQGKVPVGPRDP